MRAWLSVNQPVDSTDTNTLAQDIVLYEQAIRELELAKGPFSADLPQSLLALGTALQNKGDLEAALDYLEQASHVTRINHGLYSTQQIPILERIIENHLQQGNLVAADEQQNYLFFLSQKNYGLDSKELLPALNRFAEWNIFAFSTDAGFFGANSGPAEISVDEATFRVERLVNAQNIYWSIIEIIRNNFGSQDPRLLDAEMRLALANYLFATSFATQADPFSFIDFNASLASSTLPATSPSITSMGYRHGRDALERRRDHLNENPAADPLARLHASLDLADWMLYFNNQRGKGLEMYPQIYSALQDSVEPELLERIFSPAYPQQLPTFISPPDSRAALGIPEEQALAYKGYIDVEFELNRFGKTTAAKVLGKSADTPSALEQRLLRTLRRSQFRPRFEDGLPRLNDVIQTRYYYAW